MAPDFIYESVEEESVEIENASLLFPVTVTLRTGGEYDALLSKQVDKVCPGCVRFTDDGDESLDGHHREISLDGVCYEREAEGDVPSYALRTYRFLCAVAENIHKIGKYIDAGNMKKLDKLCRSFKCIPMPYGFYGDKVGGKYRLYWRSFGSDHTDLALRCFTAKAALLESSPTHGLGLEILPYIPKGAAIGLGKFDENAPLFCVDESSMPGVYDVKVYSKERLDEKKYDKLLFGVHNNLCSRIGEDTVIATVSGYDVIYDAPGKLLSLNQLAELLLKSAEDGEKPVFPPLFPVNWEKRENALYGRRNFYGATACYPLAAFAADSSHIDTESFYGCYAYAYLFVPAKMEDFTNITKILVEYLRITGDIPEPFIYKDGDLGCFMPIGAGACAVDADEDGSTEPKGINGVAVDFLVTDENAFFRLIKILAPVLKFYNARLIVVNGSGVNEYECGNKITPVGGADMN